jgi:hypothetical protein
MLNRSTTIISAAALAAGLSLAFTSSASALTVKECSAKYQAAKSANALGGQSWNEFRRSQCGATAAAAPAPTTTPAPPAAPPAARPAPPAAPSAAGNAFFPSGVSPKYATESAGKARMHTCLDQYRANQASNGNGGLKWIQKGGGYYSECNRQLKG